MKKSSPNRKNTHEKKSNNNSNIKLKCVTKRFDPEQLCALERMNGKTLRYSDSRYFRLCVFVTQFFYYYYFRSAFLSRTCSKLKLGQCILTSSLSFDIATKSRAHAFFRSLPIKPAYWRLNQSMKFPFSVEQHFSASHCAPL